jgi:predicted metal-dependent HD superfamily phosphohydrolase
MNNTRIITENIYKQSTGLSPKDELINFVRLYTDLVIYPYMSSNDELFYHNDNHIRSMIFKWSELPWKYMQDVNLVFAIMYHDTDYHTPLGSPGNERNAVKYFLDNWLKHTEKFKRLYPDLTIPTIQPERVSDLIMSTSRHITYSRQSDEIMNILMDLDLLSFGSNEEVFNSNSNNVIKEYLVIGIPLKDVCEGNANFIQKLLNKDWIYSTDMFRLEYEIKARKNIKKQIKKLKKLIERI